MPAYACVFIRMYACRHCETSFALTGCAAVSMHLVAFICKFDISSDLDSAAIKSDTVESLPHWRRAIPCHYSNDNTLPRLQGPHFLLRHFITCTCCWENDVCEGRATHPAVQAPLTRALVFAPVVLRIAGFLADLAPALRVAKALYMQVSVSE
jgi:hypothetical protein